MRPVARVSDDVIAGLRSSPKRLPCRLLYDATGAELFERITTLAEYYPYRTELRLLDDHLPRIAETVGPEARVIEPGVGSGSKTRLLLRALERPASYAAIDVSGEQLVRTAADLAEEYPDLDVQAVAADFTRALSLPQARRPAGKSLVFFPGSTIGNFHPPDALHLLGRFRRLVGPGGLLLLGADGTQDPDALVRAYDDAQGVTAAFDKNVLAHLNRTRAANFDLEAFDHRAVWNEQQKRIEMHLVSRVHQTVRIGNARIQLRAAEPIITEYAYKYSVPAMRGILASAGWLVGEVYNADAQSMRLWLCQALPHGGRFAEE